MAAHSWPNKNITAGRSTSQNKGPLKSKRTYFGPYLEETINHDLYQHGCSTNICPRVYTPSVFYHGTDVFINPIVGFIYIPQGIPSSGHFFLEMLAFTPWKTNISHRKGRGKSSTQICQPSEGYKMGLPNYYKWIYPRLYPFTTMVFHRVKPGVISLPHN